MGELLHPFTTTNLFDCFASFMFLFFQNSFFSDTIHKTNEHAYEAVLCTLHKNTQHQTGLKDNILDCRSVMPWFQHQNSEKPLSSAFLQIPVFGK